MGLSIATRLDLEGGGSLLTSGPVLGFLVSAAVTTVVDATLALTADDEPARETPVMLSF